MLDSKWVWLAVAMVALSGCEPEGGSGTTVAPEPAGANCAHGGVRITGSDGAVEYACNGAPGEPAELAEEPPGENCAHGGLRLTGSDGAVTYVCTASVPPAPSALCPGGNWAAGGEDDTAGLFMTLDGAFPIPGVATAPSTTTHPALDDALRLLAVCHGMEFVPPGGQSNGGVRFRPLTVVTRLDQTLPTLMTAFANGQSLDVGLRVYGEDHLARPAVDAELTLGNAQLVRVEQFLAAEPANPEARSVFVRLSFIYQSYEYETFGPGAVSAAAVQPLFLPLEVPPPCAPVLWGAGDALEATAELAATPVPASGSLDVVGACRQATRGYVDNVLTGAVDYGPLVLLKRQDGESPAFQNALLQNALTEVSLTVERRSPVTGEREDVFVEELESGRIVGYELLLQGDARLERLQFNYGTLRLTWLNGGYQFEVAPTIP